MTESAAMLLVESRRAAGWSQRELAARAGTSGPTIAAYEAGAKEPRFDTLARLLSSTGRSLAVVAEPPARSRRARRSAALAAATAVLVIDDWDRAHAMACENLERMATTIGGGAGRRWLDDWGRILDRGPEAAAEVLRAQTEHARDLQQMSPFAGLLDDRTREVVFAVVDAVGP
jgi:transcriptional regulator with XRE-family HTH domain